MATTSIGAPGVTFPDGTVQASATTGVSTMNVYTSSGTWTKQTGLRAIKVTVVGGGGNGGSCPAPLTTGSAAGGGGGGAAVRVYPAASIPGPQPYTVGGATAASSFGGSAPIITATAGGSATYGNAPNPAGVGGSGSGGQLNVRGSSGLAQGQSTQAPAFGGSSMLGGLSLQILDNSPQNGQPGSLYGGGGGGGTKWSQAAGSAAGGTGAQGVVIVEEFY